MKTEMVSFVITTETFQRLSDNSLTSDSYLNKPSSTLSRESRQSETLPRSKQMSLICKK